MKVAMVSALYPPQIGGVEKHVSGLARGLVRRGVGVEVFTHSLDGRRGAVVDDGVVVHRYPALARSTAFPMAMALVRDLGSHAAGFDLVHAHNYHSVAPVAASLARATRLVLTPHFHDTGHTGARRAVHQVYRPVARRVLRSADSIVCVSSAERELLLARFGELADRVVVIPNGIEAAEFEDVVPHPTAGRTILSVGRLEEYKAVDEILRALPPVDAQLVVIGDGPHRVALERLAADLGLQDRVQFLGSVPREALVRWMITADVVVTCSRREAYGLVVAEALSAGSRVVASAIPAHRELADRVGGDSLLLVPVDAPPEELTHTICRSLQAGRPVSAPAPRTVEAMLDDVAELYSKLCGEPPRRSRAVRRRSGRAL